MKNIKKNNIKNLPIHSIIKGSSQNNRVSLLLSKRLDKNIQNQGDIINIQKAIKDFKSEKSHTKTERSKQSVQSNKHKPSNIAYQSYTHRYNNSAIIKNLLQNKKNITKNNDTSQSTLKLNSSTPLKRIESQTNRYKKKQQQQSEKQIFDKILLSVKEFQLVNQNSEFEAYMKAIIIFNERLTKMISQIKQHKLMKSVLAIFQGIIKEISKKCLTRLYDKQNEFEQSVNEDLKSINQVVQQQYKIKYEKKINKLVQIINQKEKKEREVTKLFYYLRMNGVNLENAWINANREEKKEKKIQKNFTEEY